MVTRVRVLTYIGAFEICPDPRCLQLDQAKKRRTDGLSNMPLEERTVALRRQWPWEGASREICYITWGSIPPNSRLLNSISTVHKTQGGKYFPVVYVSVGNGKKATNCNDSLPFFIESLPQD